MRNLQASETHSSLAPGRVKPIDMAAIGMDVADFRQLAALGINIPANVVMDMMDCQRRFAGAKSGMDSLTPLITTASVLTPVQFLQAWLPGFVATITAARQIDDFIGLSTIGAWEDEQVVQSVLDVTGVALPYGDTTNVPLSNYNLNFVTRSVVRFEAGLQVERLEEMRASRVRVSAADSKRMGSSEVLEIQRNAIGFFGYNNGANQTYGLLNDPNLPDYIPVAASGSGSSQSWADKDFLEITADIRTAVIALRTQSLNKIDPKKTPLTLGLPANSVDYLTVTSNYNISVQEWIDKNYPSMRVVSAPELDEANGGENVLYLYADSVNDGMSTDDRRTFIQAVPSKFMTVGVAKTAKGYEEDYSNATAGVMLKRPYAIVRYTGI